MRRALPARGLQPARSPEASDIVRNRPRAGRVLQLGRRPRDLPRMVLNSAVTDLSVFRYEDFALEGYDPHPHIKAKVAV